MIGTVFLHKDAAKVSREFVAVVAHGNTSHASGEYVYGGEKREMCGIYDLEDCSVHENLRQAVSQKGLLKGVGGTPTHIIYNPHDLSEISRYHGANLGKIEDTVKEAQKVLGTPVTWKQFSKLRATLDDASELIAAEDYRKAIKALDGFEPGTMKGLAEEAAELEAGILAAGEKLLDEARTLIEAEEKPKALKILRTVSRDFAGTEVGEAAKELIPQAK